MDSAKLMNGLIAFAVVIVLFFCIVSNSHGAIDKEVPQIPIEEWRLDGMLIEWTWQMELYIELVEKMLRERYEKDEMDKNK